MFTTIIPVVNQVEMTSNLLFQISKNFMIPKEVILIDNGSKDNYKKVVNDFSGKLNIVYIRFDKNIGVNPSWNLGIKIAKEEYINILNNDIEITNSFYSKIYKIFEQNKNIGIVVPNTVNVVFTFNEYSAREPEFEKIKTREGWAFTIRKEITDKIKPIPSELNRCFGDDYLFYMTRKLKYKVVKNTNNLIYHYGSVTQLKELKKENCQIKKMKK